MQIDMFFNFASITGSLTWAVLLADHCAHANSTLESLHHAGEDRLGEPLLKSAQPFSKTIRCIVSEQRYNKPSVLTCDGVVFRSSIKEPAAEADELPAFSQQWFLFFGCCCTCIIVAALAAGLTLGLTSLEEFDLKVLCNELPEEVEEYAYDSQEARAKLLKDQACAQTILPLISGNYFRFPKNACCAKIDPTNEHYLLVTLLLANATANEALPLFLDKLVPAWLACILSVTVVLFFGEIIPSAIFTGPNKLSLAARLCPLVACAKLLFTPLVWPISLGLDKFLGAEDEEEFDRPKIKALIRTLMPAHEGVISNDEAKMIHGVLEMHRKTALNVGKKLTEAKMLCCDTEINQNTVRNIMSWGHSRIFVYKPLPDGSHRIRDNVMGVLLVKKLLTVDCNAGMQLRDLDIKAPVALSPHDNLLSVLNKFQEGSSHLGIVSDYPEDVIQAIQNDESIPDTARPYLFLSLEDVIEELLKEEIYDEDDVELGLRDGAVRTVSRARSWGADTEKQLGDAPQTFKKRASRNKVRNSIGGPCTHRMRDAGVLSTPLMGTTALISNDI